jgi:hypothetical protein
MYKSRRRHRHCRTADAADQARAVSFQRPDAIGFAVRTGDPHRIDQLTEYFVNHGVINRVDAVDRAYVAIGKIVQKQAFILAFSDTFYVLGVALIVALLAGLALKRFDNLDGDSPQLEIYNQPRGGGLS